MHDCVLAECREETMDWFAGEPTLDDTLSDPIVQAMMKRDDVQPEGFRRFLRDVSGRLDALASARRDARAKHRNWLRRESREID